MRFRSEIGYDGLPAESVALFSPEEELPSKPRILSLNSKLRCGEKVGFLPRSQVQSHRRRNGASHLFKEFDLSFSRLVPRQELPRYFGV